jgi:hypothetical protein
MVASAVDQTKSGFTNCTPLVSKSSSKSR